MVRASLFSENQLKLRLEAMPLPSIMHLTPLPLSCTAASPTVGRDRDQMSGVANTSSVSCPPLSNPRKRSFDDFCSDQIFSDGGPQRKLRKIPYHFVDPVLAAVSIRRAIVTGNGSLAQATADSTEALSPLQSIPTQRRILIPRLGTASMAHPKDVYGSNGGQSVLGKRSCGASEQANYYSPPHISQPNATSLSNQPQTTTVDQTSSQQPQLPMTPTPTPDPSSPHLIHHGAHAAYALSNQDPEYSSSSLHIANANSTTTMTHPVDQEMANSPRLEEFRKWQNDHPDAVDAIRGEWTRKGNTNHTYDDGILGLWKLWLETAPAPPPSRPRLLLNPVATHRRQRPSRESRRDRTGHLSEGAVSSNGVASRHGRRRTQSRT